MSLRYFRNDYPHRVAPPTRSGQTVSVGRGAVVSANEEQADALLTLPNVVEVDEAEYEDFRGRARVPAGALPVDERPAPEVEAVIRARGETSAVEQLGRQVSSGVVTSRDVGDGETVADVLAENARLKSQVAAYEAKHEHAPASEDLTRADVAGPQVPVAASVPAEVEPETADDLVEANTKDELLALADEEGVEVNSSDTKAEIADAIVEARS